MGFTLGREKETGTVTVRHGALTKTEKKQLANDIGVNLTLNTETGEVDGRIVFHTVKTSLKSKNELIDAIEKAINEHFKPKM